MIKEGILYCATRNKKYLNEAIISAKSVKKHCPELSITLVTDIKEVNEECFDSVLSINHYEELPFLARMEAMINTPYEKTLFLDSDTTILKEDIKDLFTLLDHFDIAAAHAAYRIAGPIPEIPKCFPEFNCGVILYRKSEKVINVLKEWYEIYKNNINNLSREHGSGGDQTSFRYLMWNSDLRIATLTPEYNYRPGLNNKLHQGLANNNRVTILHVHGVKKYLNYLNENRDTG